MRDARSLFASALADCSVERAYERKLEVDRQGGRLLVRVAGASVDLTGVRNLSVVAAGKASVEMLAGFLSRVRLGPECTVRGVLIGRERPAGLGAGIEFFAGGHPLPNQASFDGAGAALRLVREAAALKDALCLFLISGGASAMMEVPLAPEVSVEETAMFYEALVHGGGTISEINCIRKHFSAVKGGRLGLAAGGTPSLTLLVSDVPSQHLDSLASGPTVPDPTTNAECRALLSRYGLEDALPEGIGRWFSSATMPETPKPGEVGTRVGVLLDSDDLAASAGRYARALGYHVVLDHGCDDWPYDQAAEYLLDRMRVLRREHERVCLLSAGEVTVAVPGSLAPGVGHVGGRNQHFAVYLASLLASGDEGMAVLSAGSDGIDGNSLAAGGVVSRETLRVGERLQEAHDALERFDSSSFLASCEATVVTGPTGNNLRDLRILLGERVA